MFLGASSRRAPPRPPQGREGQELLVDWACLIVAQGRAPESCATGEEPMQPAPAARHGRTRALLARRVREQDQIPCSGRRPAPCPRARRASGLG
eukprot:153831-Pyramimonas_sp.AAC.1